MSSNGTMANSSKKRKASELDSDLDSRPSKSKPKQRPKRTKDDAKAVEEIPFTPECPYKPSARTNDDVFVQREEIAPGFEFDFGVRPGLQWRNMRSYRNVKLQDHTFSVGTVIYINKQNPPPESPRSDATDAEMLRYDRLNFWVGRIADTRAESDKAVFLRVFWLYWPEELPMGRQPYHGDRELVLSNAMDIVDAQTISGAADLTHWDERESTHQYRDRFWRQTFDISKLGKDKKGGLSELRKHCECQQPHNPDRTMFQCKRTNCNTWNHEECLIRDVLQRAWTIYQKTGTLDSMEIATAKTEEQEGKNSLHSRLYTPVRHLGKKMQSMISPSVNAVGEQSVLHPIENVTNGNGSTHKKGKQPKKQLKSHIHGTPPWDGKLTMRIINTDEKDDDSPIIARIEETATKKSKSEPRNWQVHVDCLVCQQSM